MGLIRRPGKGVMAGMRPQSCTLVFLNRCGGLEEPSPTMEKGVDLGLIKVARDGRGWGGNNGQEL
jgi:hypothetical protein